MGFPERLDVTCTETEQNLAAAYLSSNHIRTVSQLRRICHAYVFFSPFALTSLGGGGGEEGEGGGGCRVGIGVGAGAEAGETSGTPRSPSTCHLSPNLAESSPGSGRGEGEGEKRGQTKGLKIEQFRQLLCGRIGNYCLSISEFR